MKREKGKELPAPFSDIFKTFTAGGLRKDSSHHRYYPDILETVVFDDAVNISSVPVPRIFAI